MCVPGAITPHISTRRHREMKPGFVIQTAVALYLLLSPAQVGSEAIILSSFVRRKEEKLI